MAMNEAFEKSFADLAYAALSERDSQVMQYVIGFQLITTNDEGTRAVGFFALNVSGQHYYVPVFFIGGKLKPLELLYSKDEDQFMPLTSQWLNYLNKDKNAQFGTVVKKPNYPFSNPDLTPFQTPQTSGRIAYASSLDTYDLMNMCKVTAPRTQSQLGEIVKHASENIKVMITKAFLENESLMKKASSFLSWEDLRDALDTTRLTDLNKAAAVEYKKRLSDVVILEKASMSKAEIDYINEDAVRKALISNGLAAVDRRPITSEVYRGQKPKEFSSVTHAGVYRVVDDKGTMRLVLASTTPLEFPADKKEPLTIPQGRRNIENTPRKNVVIDLKSGTVFTPVNKALIGEKHPDSKSIISKVIQNSLHHSSIKPEGRYVLIYKRGADLILSEPFRVNSITQNEIGLTHLSASSSVNFNDFTIVIRNSAGPSVGIYHGVMTITSDIRFLPVQTNTNYSDPISGGNEKVFSAYLLENELQPISIMSDGVEAAIRTAYDVDDKLSKKACAELLAKKFGIKGDVAIDLTKQAFIEKDVSFFVKVAYPAIPPQYAAMPYGGDPIYYNDPTVGAPTTVARTKEILQTPIGNYKRSYRLGAKVGDNVPGYFNDQGIRPVGQPGSEMDYEHEQPPTDAGMDLQMAMQAAQTGNAEVFDAGILGSLANVNDANELVTGFIPELETALDRLGRMIYVFWWKYESFADQYSVNELYETEDSLRNLFKALGDIIIKFKRKGTASASIKLKSQV